MSNIAKKSTISGNSVDDNMRRSQIFENISMCQMQLARHQENIRNISAENEQLKKEIASVSGAQYDYVKADKLATLQGEVDSLERRYQYEKLRKNDLNKKYQLSRIDLLHSRKLKGGVYVEKEQAEAVQRQVDILENRLDQALGKFNDALSYNKELRDQIDVIREERRVFQRVHRKLEEELCEKKNAMAERIEQGNLDMDERDEHLREVEHLKRAIMEQNREHDESIRQLDAAMMEIKAMREEQTTLQLELEAREYEFESQRQDAATVTQAPGANSSMGQSSNGTLTRRRGPLDDMSDVDGEDDDESGSADGKEKIRDVIKRFQEELREDDMEALYNQYIRLGESNFSLYKFINETTTNKEALEEEINGIKSLLNEESSLEEQQKRTIKELEVKLAETEANLDQIREAVSHQKEGLLAVRSAAEDVYAQIGCVSTEGILDTCTEANLLQFLGAIEERTTYILCAFQRRHRVEAKRLETQLRQESSAARETLPEEEEENALTTNTDSPHNPLLASDVEEDIYEVAPLAPIAPSASATNVSAAKLVRQIGLPCATLGGDTNTGDALDDLADDEVVSHEEIRRQMERRLQNKRDREERALRKKREIKDMIAAGSPRHKGA